MISANILSSKMSISFSMKWKAINIWSKCNLLHLFSLRVYNMIIMSSVDTLFSSPESLQAALETRLCSWQGESPVFQEPPADILCQQQSKIQLPCSQAVAAIGRRILSDGAGVDKF